MRCLIAPAAPSEAEVIFALGAGCFRGEWSAEEVAEILVFSKGTSFVATSGGAVVGFLLGLPFYIPQIPSPKPRCQWARVEGVGRVSYIYLAPGCRGKGLAHALVGHAELAHMNAGRTHVAGTVSRSLPRYRPTRHLYERMGYVVFDNFGCEMLPQYDYLIKHLQGTSR